MAEKGPTISISVDSTQAEQGLSRVDKKLDKVASSADLTSKATGRLSDKARATAKSLSTITGPLNGIASRFTTLNSLINTGSASLVAYGAAAAGITLGIRKVISASIEQEKAVSQLNATLRSTQGAAGLTSSELQNMAASLQKVSTYGDETIIKSQALLLTFTKVGRETFPRAQKAILDMATAMGTGLKEATVQVGKALNDPILGVSALSRVGVQFSESQKEMIKSLVQTNQVAEAQAVILKELETQFEGSAEAARNTLGGALAGLGNAFGDLFELNKGQLSPITDAINGITDNLDTLASAAALAATVMGTRFAVSVGTAAASMISANVATLAWQASVVGLTGSAALAAGAVGRFASASLALVGGPIGAGLLAIAGAYYLLGQRTQEAVKYQDAWEGVATDFERNMLRMRNASKETRDQFILDTKAKIEAALAERQALLVQASRSVSGTTLQTAANEIGARINNLFGGNEPIPSELIDKAKTATDNIQRLQDGLKKLKEISTGVNAETGKLSDSAQKLVDDLTLEYEQQKKLTDAHKKGKAALKEANIEISIQNELRKEGIDADSEAGKQISKLIRLREMQKGKLAELTKVEKTRQTESKKAQKEAEKAIQRQQKLLDKPLETFLENTQTAFADSFKGIFKDGVDGFKGFFNKIGDLALDFAAEMAAMLIFKPQIIAQVSAQGTSGGLLGGITGGAVPGGGGGLPGISNLFGGGQGGILDTINSFGASNLGLANTAVLDNAAAFGAGGPISLNVPSSSGLFAGNAASLGGILGGAGLGFGLSGLFGNGSIGSQIGGSLGGAAGSLLGGTALGSGITSAVTGAIGGTLGTTIGSVLLPGIGSVLGSLVGGLFGGNPPDEISGFSARLGKNGLASSDVASKTIGTEGGTQLRDAAAKFFEGLGSTLGVDLSGQRIEGAFSKKHGAALALGAFENNPLAQTLGTQRFEFNKEDPESLQKAFAELSVAMLKNVETSGDLRIALDNIDTAGRNAQEILSDLEFAAKLEDLGKAPEKINVVEEAVKTLNATFDKHVETARRLGLAEEKVEAARQRSLQQLEKEFVGGVGKETLGLLSPIAQQIIEEDAKFRDQLRSAQALGADTTLIELNHKTKLKSLQEQLNAEQIKGLEEQARAAEQLIGLYGQLADNLRKTVESLRLSDISPISLEDRLAEAQKLFADKQAAALAGDLTAANELGDTGKRLIELSRQFNASTAAFAKDFQTVEDGLNAVRTFAEAQKGVQQGIADSARAQAASIAQGGTDTGFLTSPESNTVATLSGGQQFTRDSFDLLRRAIGSTVEFGGGNFREELNRDPELRALYYAALYASGQGTEADARILDISQFDRIPGFAKGGVVPPNGPFLVGERGPEVMQRGGGAKVTPIMAGDDIIDELRSLQMSIAMGLDQLDKRLVVLNSSNDEINSTLRRTTQ